jgi:hypothetical protein
MKLKELFFLKYGVNRELVHMQECDPEHEIAVPFVSRTSKNSGISAYVLYEPDSELNPPNTISVATSGTVLSSFLQKKPYYSGRDIYVLTPKVEMSDIELLFYCKTINMNQYKYNYGRQANKTLGDLELPIFQNFFPNYHFSLENFKIDEQPFNPKPTAYDFKSFELGEIFTVKGTKTTKPEIIKDSSIGKFPYITCKASDCGIESYHDFYTEEKNVLTIESAAIGYCSYRDENFSASDHVEKLIPKFHFNKYIGLYLSTVINKNNFRFNYGRKANQERIKGISVLLPIRIDSSVDTAVHTRSRVRDHKIPSSPHVIPLQQFSKL